jgi:hypothetical protein
MVFGLYDGNFDTCNAAATKCADLASFVGYDAVFVGMDGEVAADFGANTAALSHADLADDYLADFNFLATKKFDAEALSRTIVYVFGGTAGFYV